MPSPSVLVSETWPPCCWAIQEAQARAARVTRPRGVSPVETLEDVRQVAGGNARPLVADDQPHLRPVPLQAQLDGPAGRRVLQGVVQQDQDELLEAAGVAGDG